MICDNIVNDKRQNNRQNSYTFPISRRTTQQNLITEGYFHLGGIISQNERASVELFFYNHFPQINNIATNKMKHCPQLFLLGP